MCFIVILEKRHSDENSKKIIQEIVEINMIFFKSFLKDFILIFFRQRGTEGAREGGKHQCAVASHTPHTGDMARNPGMYSDWGLNQWPLGSQVDIQSTEPHQPGLNMIFLRKQNSWVFSKFIPSSFWSQSVPTFSLLEYNVSCVLSYTVFILLRQVLSIPNLLRVFILKGCWILWNAVLHLKQSWFLSLILLMWYITFIDLLIIKVL